jgi:GNAT superfamily N-acetyltransferase
MSRASLQDGLEQGTVEDLAAASNLIGVSWKENRQEPLEYTPEFLRSLAAFPSDLPVVAPAIYDRGELAAFVMGFPRRMRFEGEVRDILLMTFFTVAPAHKGRGLGGAIWAECLRQAKTLGYHGALHYCGDRNPSNAVTLAGAESAGFKAHRIFTIRYMLKMLTPAARLAESPRVSDDLFLAAAESLRVPVPLRRVWTAAEVEWLHARPGSIVSAHPGGGVLGGYAIHSADAAHTRCFFIEDILWDNLDAGERHFLLLDFLQRAAQHASVAVLPVLGYADLSPFLANRFRRSPRSLHAYLTLFTGTSVDAEFPGLYADVT